MLYLQSKLVGIQVLTNLLELLPLNEKGIYMNEIYTEPWWSMDISSFWQFVLSVKKPLIMTVEIMDIRCFKNLIIILYLSRLKDNSLLVKIICRLTQKLLLRWEQYLLIGLYKFR
jgi:hypothetical protein